jgi:two-component system, cell cycle response regulator
MMRIAIVDDDPISRQILKSSLKRFGHEVIEAPDGEAAWQLIQDHSPRFIITDWLMPKMDGLELIRNIRAANLQNYTYIIIISGKEDKNDVVAGLESGADDYLVKPFDVMELRARVSIGVRILELEADLKIARDQMEAMAMHDYLTGLLSRRAIYTHLKGELDRSLRENHPLSIIMMDLDRFKDLNDQYGHLVGDQALCLVSDQILRNVRSYDWAGRWGGDEFLIVLPNTSAEEARTISERICSKISSIGIETPDHAKVYIQSSLGVITHKFGSISIDHLIHQTDNALYAAKIAGRHCVHYSESVMDEADV